MKNNLALILLTVSALLIGCNNKPSLPDPLEAGCNDQPVSEVLEENATLRVL